jgi:hypothetical protein
MTSGGLALLVLLAVAPVAGLAGCGSGTETAVSTSASTPAPSALPNTSAATSATAKSTKGKATKGAPTTTVVTVPPTTSTLGAFPPILSHTASPVDSGAIRSLADLPAAFQCIAAVGAITIPPTGDSPASVVCPSKLAGGEALYLWFVGSPDERYLALKAAMDKANYIHGGSSWVAGGLIDPSMGSVGGDVYK